MFATLLTLLILDGIVLMVSVLLQSGKGGGLAAMGGGMGSDNLIGGRQAATLLTRTSWTTGGIFLVLSFILSIMSAAPGRVPESILRQEFQQTQPVTAPQPVVPGAQPQSGGEAGQTSEAPPAQQPQP